MGLPQPQVSEASAPALGGLVPLTDEGLRRFDAALPSPVVHTDLLHRRPGKTLMDRLSALVASLRVINVEGVARRQGWWSRLTGADLEARLELESACYNLVEDLAKTRAAAGEAAHAADLMRAMASEIIKAQHQLESLIATGRRALQHPSTTGSELAMRLERRVANASALHASNTLAAAQLSLTINHLNSLTDRFADVDKLLFPVWLHHAMLVSASTEDSAAYAEDFRAEHGRLIAGASPDPEGSAT